MKVILTGWIEAEGQLQSWHPSIKEEKRKKRKRKKGGEEKGEGEIKTNKQKQKQKERSWEKALSGFSKSKGKCPRWRLLGRAFRWYLRERMLPAGFRSTESEQEDGAHQPPTPRKYLSWPLSLRPIL